MDDLENILRCCESISRNSLTYRTLSTPVPRHMDKKIYLEKELAEWLDQRIFDYRVKLKAYSNSEALQDDALKQQRSLSEETKRQQQDLLVLRHLANSKIVKRACSDKGDPLIRDCLRVRSKLGKRVAHLSQQSNDLRGIVEEKLRTFRQIKHESEQLWEEVKSQKEKQRAGSTDSESRLRKENRLLKFMISDLLAGSKLDWCEDPRLLQIMCLHESLDC